MYIIIYILYLLLLICLIDGEQQDMRLSLQHSISCCALDICQPSFALGLQISQSGHASGIGLSVYRYLFFCQFRHNSWSYGRIPPWPEISASWPIPIYRWECLKTGVPQTSHISIKVEGFGAPLFWDIPTRYDWGQKKGFWPQLVEKSSSIAKHSLPAGQSKTFRRTLERNSSGQLFTSHFGP